MKLLNPPVKEYRNAGLFLLIFSFMLNQYYLDIGFALKPYMIFLALFLLFHLATFAFRPLYFYEVILLLFYLFYSFTGVFSAYPFASIRIMLGIVLLLICYFILKFAFEIYSDSAIQSAIAGAGLLFNTMSFVLYIIGLKSTGFHIHEEMMISYGVLSDRGFPRLVGLLDDPNLYVFYNTLFFTYFLTNRKNTGNKIGFVLSLLTTVLTFSRGGILAMLLIFLLYIAVASYSEKLKMLVSMGVISIVAGYVAISINFNIGGLFKGRIEDLSTDGGSGRFELWGRAWDYFLQHPLIGIGPDNFIEYNKAYYGENLYTHNTFLQILSESGLLGFTLYATFLTLVCMKLMNHRLIKEKPYLLLSFVAIIIQTMSLSLIINEIFFLYLALLAAALQKEERRFVIQQKDRSFTKEAWKNECAVNDR